MDHSEWPKVRHGRSGVHRLCSLEGDVADMTSHATESAKYLLADREILRKALTIRRTEEMLLRLSKQGDISGTIHTAIGQELPALAVVGALGPEDWVFSNHRGHAHFLA